MLFKFTNNKPYQVNGKDVISRGDTIDIEGSKIINLTKNKSIDIPDKDISLLKSLCLFISDSSIVTPEDKVNHPSHYTWLKELCGIEVIDITRHMDFDLGNAIKYILRCGHKAELGYSEKEKTIEDLRKAIFYLEDKIKMLNK